MRTSLSIILSIIAVVVHIMPVAARPPEADVVTKLPARIEDATVAGGGRFIVMRLKGSRDLAVYDATTQKLSQIELPEEDFLFAAGGDTAVVFLREKNEIRSLDLKTGKILKAKEFIDRPNLGVILMGHSRDDLALLRMGRPPIGPAAPDLLLDVPELRVNQVKYQYGTTGGKPGEMNQLRANGDMTRLVEWAAIPQPNGAGVLSRTETGYSYLFGYVAVGPVFPGDDGRVFTALGTTMEPDPAYNPAHGGSPFKISAAVKARTLVPGIGGQFHIGVSREGGLTLYQAKSADPVCPLGDFPGWLPIKPDLNNVTIPGGGNGFRLPDGRVMQLEDMGPGAVGEGKETLTLDRRIVFAPALGHIVFIPHSNDRIVQRSFDLKSTLDQTGDEYLMVLSSPVLRVKGGTAWEYQLRSVAKNAPVKFELVRSPEGMTIAADGKMAWTAPKGIIGKAPVEVKLIDGKGHSLRQAFDVVID